MDYYGTPDGFTAYHTARGNSLVTLDTDDIPAGLLVASEWLDGKYRLSFPGYKVGMRVQVRDWPRYSAVDRNGYYIPSDALPIEVVNATYEATYKHMMTPGILNKDWTPPKYDRVSVDGAISVSYTKFTNAADVQARFIGIERILAPILTGQGNVSVLSGPTSRQ